jgi:hypothetical protein
VPAGFPSGPANLHQPPPFLALDALHSNGQGRWETLKLLRLLAWIWSGPGWPNVVPDAATAAFINGLAPGPTGLNYSTLLAHPRLSQVALMLGIANTSNNPLVTNVHHIDHDWFADLPKSAGANPPIHPFRWKTTPVTGAQTRERNFIEKLISALDRSLGLDTVLFGSSPATWTSGGPDHWPTLQGNPATATAKLSAACTGSLADKTIHHFWDNTGGSVFRLHVLVGDSTVSFVVTTPALDYP